MHTHDGYAPHSHEVRPDHQGVRRVAQDPARPDLFRYQVASGLAVITDPAGRVCVDVGTPRQFRHPVDVARVVTALETARDVGAGGPSVGSLDNHVALRLARICEDLDTALGSEHGSRQMLAERTLAELRDVWADLRYGQLDPAWLALPESHATYCPVCWMRPRLVARSAVLQHRPGCPERTKP